MIIKFAQPEDLSDIDDLCRSYHSADVSSDTAKIIESMHAMIKLNSVLACVVNGKIVGCMAGHFFPSQFSQEVFFVSIFLYFRDGFRQHTGDFIKQVIEVLKTTHANRFVTAVPHFQDQEKMGRFYKMKGFRLLETHWVLDLKS